MQTQILNHRRIELFAGQDERFSVCNSVKKAQAGRLNDYIGKLSSLPQEEDLSQHEGFGNMQQRRIGVDETVL